MDAERLNLAQFQALEYLGAFYHLWKGSKRGALQWCIPELKNAHIAPYERLVELGYAESSHLDLDAIRPKRLLSRIVFNVTTATFFPSGIQRRYRVTPAGLERLKKNVLGW